MVTKANRQGARNFLTGVGTMCLVIAVLIALSLLIEFWPHIFVGFFVIVLFILVGIAIYQGFFAKVTD